MRRFRFQKAFISSIIFIFMSLILGLNDSLADSYLNLLYTIRIPSDSARILYLATPAGDFNADGYQDMALPVKQIHGDSISAVYIYYGGPTFDTIPDLVLIGEPQNHQSDCYWLGYLSTGFGDAIISLKDFNGDGYNDLAISAAGYCLNWFEGRIYIYFGGPNPDTIPDIVIDGYQEHNNLGIQLDQGDFNGDGFSDLLAYSGPFFPYTNYYIYLGRNPPDGILDWHRQFSGEIRSVFLGADGHDINYDGYDDFCLGDSVYLGGNPLPERPLNTPQGYIPYLCKDISGDGIDDVILDDNSGSFFLSLGGDSVDLRPDYTIDQGNRLMAYDTYKMAGATKLLMNDANNRRLFMYHSGTPFDSIPEAIFDYNIDQGPLSPPLKDINCDGYEEIALYIYYSDSVVLEGIYSIMPTGIESDNGSHRNLRDDFLTLSVFPNPFNSLTIIEVKGSEILGDLNVQIVNILGQEIKTFNLREVTEKQIKITWDLQNSNSHCVSSGLYFIRAQNAKSKGVTKIVVQK